MLADKVINAFFFQNKPDILRSSHPIDEKMAMRYTKQNKKPLETRLFTFLKIIFSNAFVIFARLSVKLYIICRK